MRKRPLAAVCLVFLIIRGMMFMIWGGDIDIPADSLFSCMEEGDVRSQVKVQGRLYKKEYTSKNQVLYLEGNSITDSENSYYESKILVYDDSFEELYIGQTIQVTGTIQKFEGARNPGNFDRRMYYACQEIRGCILRGKIQEVFGEKDSFRESLFQLRQSWNDLICENLSEEQGPVLSAMLLGQKEDMSEEMRELYQKNGISHVLSISGLHISFIGLGIYYLLRKMRLGYLPSGVLSILLLSGYALMIGFSVSVLRAYLMLLLRVGADLAGRIYDMVTALMLSAAVTIAYQPLYLLDASFWLSYGAVLSILYVIPCMKQKIPPRVFEMKGVGKLLDTGLVSLAVQISLLPIILWYYYEIPIYSVLLNVVVVPCMTWVLGLGMFGSLASLISEWIGGLLLGASDWILTFVAWIGGGFADLPFSQMVLGKPDVWKVLGYYALFWIVLYYGSHKRVAVYAALFVCFFIFVPFPNGKLQVTMLDVGQGDCIFVKGPRGGTYLIDGGSSDVNEVGKYRIAPFLRSQGTDELDYVLVSHGDSDHYSGIAELIENEGCGIEIHNLVLPQNYLQSEELKELAGIAQKAEICVSTIQAGSVMREGEMEIACLQPGKDDEKISGDNAGSMVLHMQFGSFDMLFTGDLEGEGETRLLENSDLSYCDVLKVSHHGSKNSTSREFLGKIRPKISLISAGKGNAYGHPHEETLERLGENGSVIYQTMDCGAIRLETNGDLIDIFPTCI